MNDVVTVDASNSVIVRMGERYQVDPNKLYATLRKTAFKGDASDEQLMALMLVADQHKLNPFTREIYAYPDKRGGIVPVVGIDGWVRIVQERPEFDGWQFDFDKSEGAMTCTIWRKDQSHPTVVTEYLSECKRNTDAWNQMPRRMLRHRALMQCARIAFGFGGIYDEDEADEIVAPKPKVTPAPSRISEVMQMVEEVPLEPLPDYMQRLSRVDSEDELHQLLDLARTALNEQDYDALVAASRERLQPEENEP